MIGIWLRDDEPARPRRASPLTRGRIVAAAVELLDEHGAQGLAMRPLAQRLGVTPTALYWHVRTKEDVLDLAVDHVFGDVELPGPGGEWRDDVRELVLRWRAVMRAHPWAPGLVGRPLLGPNVLARTEFLQAALVRGGFGGLRLSVVTRLLANYVIGAALTEATYRSAGPDARRHIAGRAGAYPTLAASGHLDDTRWSGDELFAHGLDAILATPPG